MKKQVIISFKTKPLIFDIDEKKFLNELFNNNNGNKKPKPKQRN